MSAHQYPKTSIQYRLGGGAVDSAMRTVFFEFGWLMQSPAVCINYLSADICSLVYGYLLIFEECHKNRLLFLVTRWADGIFP